MSGDLERTVRRGAVAVAASPAARGEGAAILRARLAQ
jgi:hypothetical protein